jgi:hypothetical protein
MSRSRYTDEDKARLLGEFEACSGSAAAFCRDGGLAYQTFISWRRGTAGSRDAGNAMEFVELALGPVAGERNTVDPRVELDFGGGLVLRIHLSASRALPHPHLQIPHRRPDVPLSPLRDHPGDGDGDRPPPREECREYLVFRTLESDRLEPGLEALGQAAKVEVRGAEERLAGLHPVEVGQQQVLRVLRAAVEFVDHLDRPRAEDRPVAEVARPVAGEVEPDFPTVHVLDGCGVVGERAGDQVDQARLPDPGSAGDSLVDFFAETL